MKAAVVTGFDRPLSIEDVPVPQPGPEQVLVRIETCGLCHTDIHAARGDWPIKPTPPFIPGHEGVGIVERLGEGNAHGLTVGTRVALPWLGYSCGDCRYCNSGWETLCTSQLNMGYAINGGFAEYAVGYARNVVRVPDDVDPLDAAPLTCAGVTTYKAVKVSGARSSSVVAVFGAGGLGHLAIQYARVTGAAVIAVDINAARLETARELGAEHVVHAGEEDAVAAIQRLGGADVAIATAVSPAAFEQALGSLARGGTLGVRRAARRQRDQGPGVRDRPRRPDDPRVDRGHAPRSRRGLRASPPRPDARAARGARARRRQRGHRAGARRQRAGAADGLRHAGRAHGRRARRPRDGRRLAGPRTHNHRGAHHCNHREAHNLRGSR